MSRRGSLPPSLPLSTLLAPHPTAIAERKGPRPMIERHNPSGCGIYTMGLHKLPPAGIAAKQAASAGLSFVAILACWQEASSHVASNASRLEEYGAAFREAGLDVWCWGYPWGSIERIEQFAPTMKAAAVRAGASGILLDPELGFKGRDFNEGRARFMRPLLDRTIETLSEGLGLGITSYGMASAHPDFPWETAGGYGFGSPQFYSVPLSQARKGIEQWRAHGWKHIVASVPTFGENSGANTAAYAGAIAEHCEGLCFWQWATTNAEEWRAIEAVAKRYYTATPDRSVA